MLSIGFDWTERELRLASKYGHRWRVNAKAARKPNQVKGPKEYPMVYFNLLSRG